MKNKKDERLKFSGSLYIIKAILFARIHTSYLIKTEEILNRPTTKFYSGDDVNVIAAELWLNKMGPLSFYKKYNLL